MNRFDESGLDGWIKRPTRSGSRPPEVSEEKFAEIKRELSENLAGWRAKEVMNIIYEKTGVRYIMKYMSTDYCTSGNSVLRFQERDS